LEYSCNSSRQFTDRAQCLAVAGKYSNTPADAIAANRNNLGCREYHAQAAASLKTADHCAHAGPSGGGQCGSQLEAWASLLNTAPCNDVSVKTVVDSVAPAIINAAIPPGFNATVSSSVASYTFNYDQAGNTQACRIYHLGVALSGNPSHCSHGDLSGGENCGTNLKANLCKAIGAVCGFAVSAWQFPTEAACVTDLTSSATNNITMGTTVPQDTSTNSYACRYYHTGVAATYLLGGSAYNASMMTANTEGKEFHCGHVLKRATAGGCGATTTGTPMPTPKTSAAPAISLLALVITVVASVFSL